MPMTDQQHESDPVEGRVALGDSGVGEATPSIVQDEEPAVQTQVCAGGDRPAAPALNPDAIPQALRGMPRWVCWRYEDRDGRQTKVPYIASGDGLAHASVSDSTTWRSFDQALKASSRHSGIGLVLGDGLAGIDLDKCRDPETGSIEPSKAQIVRRLDSYTEVSPSGTGVHVLVWGEKPAGTCRSGNIEIYDRGRFLCVTGAHIDGTPETVEKRTEELAEVHERHLLDRAGLDKVERLAKRDAKFGALWAGAWDTLPYQSQSEADLALMGYLRNVAKGDRAQMKRLFRRSGLHRDKSEREDYLDRTIDKALDGWEPSAGPWKRKTIRIAELADAVLAEDHFARDDGDRLYGFSAGVYVSGGSGYITERVKTLLAQHGREDQWSTHRVSETIAFIAADAPRLWETPPLDTLNLRNGLLDVVTGQLRPHSPEFLSPVQLPVAYDPDADCPAWREFVAQVFPDDAQELPWELAAWLMLPYTSIQRAVLLLGAGANGKSTFLTALTRFIGKRNCAMVSLHKLEEERFATASLVGKLANVCPDLPSDDLQDTSVFKALTGGEPGIHAEYKHGKAFEFECYARLVFSANYPPRSADSSEAFFRRWLVVPFSRTFTGDGAVRREDLDARLADPRELSGVLNRALAAWPRVRERGITESESMAEAVSQFQAATDPLAAWLDEHVFDAPDGVVVKQELLQAYQAHCRKVGLPVPTPQAFGRALKRLRPKVGDAQRRVNGQPVHMWVGIEHR